MKSLINRIMMKGKFRVFAVLATSLILIPTLNIVQAHGVNISYYADMTYRIEVKFDNGQPMVNGQVTIYAPDNPAEVWGEGFTNDEGVYLFTPDPNIAGDWTIKIRQAGHGSLITIPIGSDNTFVGGEGATSGSTGLSPSQKILMAACVVWGAVGTALYFKRRPQ